MDAQTLALTLLAMRFIAVALLIAVIVRQVKQIRTTTTKYPAIRISILILTIVLLIGQFIPIALDSVVAYGSHYDGRNPTPNLLPVAYSLNNAAKDVVIGSLLMFIHYRRYPKHKDFVV